MKAAGYDGRYAFGHRDQERTSGPVDRGIQAKLAVLVRPPAVQSPVGDSAAVVAPGGDRAEVLDPLHANGCRVTRDPLTEVIGTSAAELASIISAPAERAAASQRTRVAESRGDGVEPRARFDPNRTAVAGKPVASVGDDDLTQLTGEVQAPTVRDALARQRARVIGAGADRDERLRGRDRYGSGFHVWTIITVAELPESIRSPAEGMTVNRQAAGVLRAAAFGEQPRRRPVRRVAIAVRHRGVPVGAKQEEYCQSDRGRFVRHKSPKGSSSGSGVRANRETRSRSGFIDRSSRRHRRRRLGAGQSTCCGSIR
jgi:hypothetical protein